MNAAHCYKCEKCVGPDDGCYHAVRTNKGWLCHSCAAKKLSLQEEALAAVKEAIILQFANDLLNDVPKDQIGYFFQDCRKLVSTALET